MQGSLMLPTTEKPCGKGISLISWVNNKAMYEQLLLPGLMYGVQLEQFDIEAIVISPGAGCSNMGQAYNLGLKQASHRIKVYAHQDVAIKDRSFLTKIDVMLNDTGIGLVGIVGSEVDTGACFYHADNAYVRGMLHRVWKPEAAPVKIVDGFLFASSLDIPFCEDYEGPHLVVEDYCMRVREAGYQVWTTDSMCDHLSPGTQDDGFYRSAQTFRKTWKHMLPKKLPNKRELSKAKELLQFETNMEFVVL